VNESQVEGIVETQEEEKTSIGLPFKVILYNDEEHTFDEVIVQLIKAVGCSFKSARSFAFEVHVKGKALVFTGDLPSCLKITSILEEIALHTQILSE
jgi:ATP-dependent Clp protease adaptor protein ClpS